MIDKATIERINATANIVEVVSDFVPLKRAGASYKACCPFHSERTPSFVVTPGRGIFKCFGCGKGGDSVRFVMEHEKMNYNEALKYIARKYGIEVREREETEEERRQNNDAESMMVLNSWATEYFAKQLYDNDEGLSIGLGYLRERGFTEATIKHFSLGYCPRKGNTMTIKALSEGYDEKYLTDTGLSVKRENDGTCYDRFHGRVIFPIQSISGRTIGFGGRVLEKSDKTAKYVNSPESIIYSKSKTLYGIYQAKNAIVKNNFCILVEGYTDVIQMHQTGIENVVASSGTSLTTEQIRLIRRFTPNITVIYDSDKAGIKASLRGVDMVLSEGMNVRVVLLPDGEDPDSFAKNHTSDEVKTYIEENEQDFIGFKAKLLLTEAGEDPIKRAELTRDIVQSIASMPDPIQRNMFIRQTAQLMDVDAAMLTSEVARCRTTIQYDRETSEFVRSMQKQTEVAATRKVKTGSSLDVLEREIAGMLMEYGDRDFELKEGERMVVFNFAEMLFTEFDRDNIAFKSAHCRKIYDIYRREYDRFGRGNRVAPSLFINDVHVGNEAVSILTANANYTISTIFADNNAVPILGVDKRLADIVPRQVLLYKSKTIETIIEELNEQLKSENLTDEQINELLQKVGALNTVRKYTSLRLGRVIL